MSLSLVGFRFRAATFDEVLDGLAALRPSVASVQMDLLTTWLAGRATTLADEAWANGANGEHLSSAFEEFAKRTAAIKREGRRDPAVDFGFELSVVRSEVGLLGLASIEQEDLVRLVEQVADPYSYWDNTDRPDGVDGEEWKARGSAWRNALARGGYVPANCGVVFSHATLWWPAAGEVVPAVPARADRAFALARQAEMSSFAKGPFAGPDEAIKAVYEFSDYARRPEGRKAIEDRARSLEPDLPQADEAYLIGTTSRHGAPSA